MRQMIEVDPSWSRIESSWRGVELVPGGEWSRFGIEWSGVQLESSRQRS